nr:hypothetical protein [Enterobacter sp. Bisph1]
MAGQIQSVASGDFAMATGGNYLASVKGDAQTDITGQQSTKVVGNIHVETLAALTEKIAAHRQSIAASQQIIDGTVHIGNDSMNTLSMMLDTIDLLAELAQQCAGHAHPDTGTPTNASDFTQTATRAGQTRGKYQNIIACCPSYSPHPAGIFVPANQTRSYALWALCPLSHHHASHQTDRVRLALLAQLRTDKINVLQTKAALHRTRLRVLDRGNFSVLFFCKPHRQGAPVLASCG